MGESLEELIRKYAEQLAADPKSRAFVPLSDAYRKLGRYEEAIAVAEEGIKHHPHYVGGKMALARARFENGDLDPARKILEEVVPLSPDNLLANRLLSEIYVRRKEEARAIPLLRQLLKIEPNDARAAAQLAAIEGKGTTAEAPAHQAPPSISAEPLKPAVVPPEPAVAPPSAPAEVSAPAPFPPPPAAQEAERPKASPTTRTATLAELYRAQGHLESALTVYRDLAAAEPANALYAQRAQELDAQLAAQSARAFPGEVRVGVLNRLLGKIRERRRTL